MFSFTQKILFKHCDPAGIVFYPRYFEIINDVVEDYFDSALNHPFNTIVPSNGVPTAQINATFAAPSRLGDLLQLDLTVVELGRSSMKLMIEANSEGERRFSAHSVLVFVDENGKSTAWPDALRQVIQRSMSGDSQ